MNIRIIVTAALAAACHPAFADVSTSSERISASFARMLDHRPYAGQTVTPRSASERDPLEALVYTLFQAQRPARTIAADTYGVQIAASFERMLAHEPHTDPVPRIAFLNEVDPLEATIRALLREPGKAMVASR